jgi:predicted negative regulator of RcsB-dependent stress response
MTDAPLPPNGSPPDDPPATEEETQAANALRQALEGRRAGVHVPEPALETAALLRFSTDQGRLSDDRRAALRAELMAALPASAARTEKARKGLRHWLGLGLTLAGGASAVVVIGVIGARQLSTPATRQEAPFSDARSVSAAPLGVAANSERESAQRSSASARVEAEPRPAFAAKGRAARADDGAGPALGAAGGRLAEAKKSAPPTQLAVPTEQVRRESDKYRAELLAELADPRVDGAYGEVDRAHSPVELERAQQRLGALASGTFGGSKANAERLRPDIYCRLAEVALRLGQPEVALDWARRGIALGAPASPFVARLYLLEGQAKSALGDRNGAAQSYLKAIDVNEQLLDESLESP